MKNALPIAMLPAFCLLLPTPIQAQEFIFEEVCPSSAMFIPFEDMGEDGYIDTTGQGNRISFGPGAPEVCVAEDIVYISGSPDRRIACEDILNGENDGLGYPFFRDGAGFQLWLFINPDRPVRTLEMGLNEGLNGGNPYFWVETGAPLCND